MPPPLTRADCEALALVETQAILGLVFGEDAIPPVGTPVASPSTVLGPIVARALAECGVIAENPLDPTDDDCAKVPDQARARLTDCLAYYALLSAATSYLDDSVSAGQVSVSSSGLGGRLQFLLKMKADQLKARYGIGTFQSPGLAVAVIPPLLPRPVIPFGANWPPPGLGYTSGRYPGRRW